MKANLDDEVAKTMKLLGDRHACGWVDCTKVFYGDSPPFGWMTLDLCRHERQRKLFLCPTHGSGLERELKAEQNA